MEIHLIWTPIREEKENAGKDVHVTMIRQDNDREGAKPWGQRPSIARGDHSLSQGEGDGETGAI